MNMYALYLANARGTAFSPVDLGRLHDLVQRRFQNYTLLAAEGCWRGQIIPTMVVKVADADAAAVRALAEELRTAYGQRAVGLEAAGRFESVGPPIPAEAAAAEPRGTP